MRVNICISNCSAISDAQFYDHANMRLSQPTTTVLDCLNK